MRRTPDPEPAMSDPRPAEAFQARLEELRLCLQVLRRQPGPVDSPQCAPMREALGEALRAEQRKLFTSLVAVASALLDRGLSGQARAVLETLARNAPKHPVLHADSDRPAGPGAADPVSDRVGRYLASLREDACWLSRPGDDNLRAVLGLDLFKAGRHDLARMLLGQVRWDAIGDPEPFTTALSTLYWSGLATVVERMVSCPGLPLAGEHRKAGWEATTVGVFAALTGHPQTAEKWLVPQLDGSVSSPPQLFQIFDGLLYAARDGTLRAYFETPGTLDELWRRFDFEQRERLSAVLYNVGLTEEAGRRFEALADSCGPVPRQALPRLTHALMQSGRERQAARLIENARSAGACDAHEQGEPPADVPLAESLLLAGNIEEARTLLNRIPLPRVPCDPLAPRLFLLHERLSQIDALRELRPAIFGDPVGISHDNMLFFLKLSFYERTLETDCRDFMAMMGPALRHRAVLLAQARFLFELGQFSELREVLDDPLLAGNGFIALPRLYLSACLHLSRNAFAPARQAFASLASVVDKVRLNIFLRQPYTPFIFEYALLLRFLGETRQALTCARDCVRRFGAFANPCFALEGLLAREVAGLDCDAGQADVCEAVADRLCQPRFFCQGWLYLRAAGIHHRLGRHGEATRILRGKLARTLFLAPQTRTRLLAVTSEALPELAEAIPAMFFPRFRGTYWTALIESLLDDIR